MTNWRVWILTSVAAVGGASILGLTAPVRAAEVTYTLENAELANGWDVTGSLIYDDADEMISDIEVKVTNAQGDLEDEFVIGDYIPQDRFIELLDDAYNITYINLDSDLTGAAGQEDAILNNGESVFTTHDASINIVQGSVSDGSAGPSSVPEPSSIMATVTAVTLGVGLRRMKRKV